MSKTISRKDFTWTEYVETAVSEPALGFAASKYGDNHWAGGSFAGAVKMATGAGFTQAMPESHAIATRVTDTVAAELFQSTFTSTWQVAGAEVDMGRFLSGEPECMIESEPIRISRQGRAVRVAVPIAYVNFVTADQVLKRGAAVMALVGILSRAQHPLEVWGVLALIGIDAKRLCYRIKVKDANAPLDEGQLMYALAHPSAFRRLGFSVMEHETEANRRTFGVPGSYGHAPYCAYPEDFPEEGGTTIILPDLGRGIDWDEDYAVAWIEEQLAVIFHE